jgi:predicted nucleic acid-binding protein
VSLYLDASVLVALFTEDALTAKADSVLRVRAAVVAVSDFAAAEFASAVARLVRTRELSTNAARGVFSTFDAWAARAAARVETTAADVAAAAAYLRRLDLTLRTPDALNIAIAQRIDADLLTFDRRMHASAWALGIRLAPGGP